MPRIYEDLWEIRRIFQELENREWAYLIRVF
jgi:hypothetical protein